MYRVFIASSSEGKGIAKAIASACDTIPFLDPVPWWQPGVFQTTEQSLVSLIGAIKSCDLGFFVATPDDLAQIRNELSERPRDNVVLEFGLFAGINGLSRSAYFQIGGSSIASDLQGITVIRLPHGQPDGDGLHSEDYLSDVASKTKRAAIELLSASSRSPSVLSELHSIERRLFPHEFIPILQHKKKDDFDAIAFAPPDGGEIEKILERHREAKRVELGLEDRKTVVDGFFEFGDLEGGERKALVLALSERIPHALLSDQLDGGDQPPPTCAVIDVNDDVYLLVQVASRLGLRPILVDPEAPVHSDCCIGFSIPGERAIFLHDFTISGRTPLQCIARTRLREIKVTHVFSLLARNEFENLRKTFEEKGIIYDALLREDNEKGVVYCVPK